MFDWTLWGTVCRNRWGRAGGRKSVADRHCSVDRGQNHRQTQTSPQCLGALNMPTSSIIFFPWVPGSSSNEVEESCIYECFKTEYFNQKKNTIFLPTCILGLRNVFYSQCTFYHKPVLVKLRDWWCVQLLWKNWPWASPNVAAWRTACTAGESPA